MDRTESDGGCFRYTLAHSHLGQQGRFVLSVCPKCYSLRYGGAHANGTHSLRTLFTQDFLCSPHMEKPLDNEH